MKTRRTLVDVTVLGLVVYGLWLILSGHYTPFLLMLGLLSTAAVVYIAIRMDLVDDEGVPLLSLSPRLWLYLPWLVKEIVVSNLTVMKIVLQPNMPINPAILRFKAIQRTDLGKVIFANSITLTPGTTTVAITRDGEFFVHALVRDDSNMAENEMSRRVATLERKVPKS